MNRHARLAELCLIFLVATAFAVEAQARERMLDAQFGLFMQRDPLGTALHNTDLNYRHSSNSRFTVRDNFLPTTAPAWHTRSHDANAFIADKTTNFPRRYVSGFLAEGKEQYHDGMNLYEYQKSNTQKFLDPQVTDVTNNSNFGHWVHITGMGWQAIAPGQTIVGDTDFIAWGQAFRHANGVGFEAFKIIDCYDAEITAAQGPNQIISIKPVYAGILAGRGDGLVRKCICASPALAGAAQLARGGVVSIPQPGIPKPPNYP